MDAPLSHAVRRLADGCSLTQEETAAAFGVIMRGEAPGSLIAALLMGLRTKGEAPEELAGAATALREAMVRVRPGPGSAVVDTCGTGGGAISTFNLSTAAGFVTAAAGTRVAKHGNRSFTSRCGSADVLEALGVDIGLGADRAAERLDAIGMVFLFAPNYHPAMRHVGQTRKELGITTIMNLLGPLANPAGVTRQVIGVADRDRAPLLANALVRLGAEHALVVHGEVGMDEISPVGHTAVWEVQDGRVVTWRLDPAEYRLEWKELGDLAGGDPADNARRIEQLLTRGKGGQSVDEPGRRAVLLNAAAALYVSGRGLTFKDAVDMASHALAEGRARALLDRMRGR